MVATAFGTTLSLLVGHQLGVTASPYPAVPEFPHLASAGHDDIPSLGVAVAKRQRAQAALGDASMPE